MKRVIPSLVLAFVLIHGSPVPAQPPGFGGGYRNPGTVGRPTFSPYLNLLRNGNTTLNYYGLVRPENRLRQEQLRLESQYQSLRSTNARDGEERSFNSQLGSTGHTSYYNGGYRFLQRNEPSVTRLQIMQIEREGLRDRLGQIEGSRLGPTGHATMSGLDRSYFGQPR